MHPLFQHYPALAEQLPHIALGNYPSAVQRLERLEATGNGLALYLKRDDAAGEAYAGNKLRKLEYLLADAQARDAKRVLTFGAVGSNHALATAVNAATAGLACTCMLVPQLPATKVCRNLLANFATGSELLHYPDEKALAKALPYQLQRHARDEGSPPVVIPGGGTSPLGSIGYVAAAFELAAQVQAGELPEPHRIYLPLGTTGTAAGLALGLRVAGLRSQLVAVRVTDLRFGSRQRMEKLIEDTSALLHQRSAGAFPRVAADECAVDVRHDCFGGQYARYTPEAIDAVRQVFATQGIRLEGTYTGKAMAALLQDRMQGASDAGPQLFWNTFSSRPLRVGDGDYRALPTPLHRYFEMQTQPLDGEMERVFADAP